jgi:hypothetical protein
MTVKHDLERDLKSTSWLVDKVRGSQRYAQNLYAALCNNEFVKNDVWPILKDETWSCTWRYAGGVVSDIQEGDGYLDWYCSGMGSGLGNGDETGELGYAQEGEVTDEIREDLLTIGWLVRDEEE